MSTGSEDYEQLSLISLIVNLIALRFCFLTHLADPRYQ